MTADPVDHADVRAVIAWAKETVHAFGFDDSLLLETSPIFTESDFLRELAWVILCCGFREKAVRRCFGKISLCFCDWQSAEVIARQADICVATAMDVFRSEKKINAIAYAAKLVNDIGFEDLERAILEAPIKTLQGFPFIGPVTTWHLLKNLGFDVAKPDRHLQRISDRHGYANVHAFCGAISQASGESVRTVDTLLWRLAEMGLAAKVSFRSLSRQPLASELS